MTLATTGASPFMVRTWWRHRPALLGASCLAFAGLFVCFAAAVTAGETRSIDQSIRQWMLNRQTPSAVSAIRIVTDTGELLALVLAAVIAVWSLVRRGARILPLIVCVIPFIPRFIVHALKDVYQVTRPPMGFALSHNASFPSGHASSTTAVALVLAYVVAREGAPRLGAAIATVVPLIVGLSRLYLDMHWASDVVGGWLVGLSFASAVAALYEVMRSRRLRRLDRPRVD